ISQVTDLNDRSNVAGAGIDMAQRVMDCGDAGHILVSKRVADDLAPYHRWNRHLHDLGACEVKHGRRITVFNFFTEVLGNPELPGKFRARSVSTAPRFQPGKSLLLWPAGLITLGLAAALAYWLWPQATPPRAVAVLPFLDLSLAKDQEYLAKA
ncbi:MAG: hypothetical protein M3032_00355, partial [Verrucomicrobiota bacterium]|nr:hypothetical protein [Verrucomicrobiota bacterium]